MFLKATPPGRNAACRSNVPVSESAACVFRHQCPSAAKRDSGGGTSPKSSKHPEEPPAKKSKEEKKPEEGGEEEEKLEEEEEEKDKEEEEKEDDVSGGVEEENPAEKIPPVSDEKQPSCQDVSHSHFLFPIAHFVYCPPF